MTLLVTTESVNICVVIPLFILYIFNISDHFQDGTLIWFSEFAVFVSTFVLLAPSVCLNEIKLGLGCFSDCNLRYFQVCF